MLGDALDSAFQAWDTCATRVAGSAENISPRPRPAAYTSDVGAGEERNKDIFEVLVDEYVHGVA